MILRKAKLSDAQWLYNLRNDPTVLAMSSTPMRVDAMQHCKWFTNALEDPNHDIRIAEVNGTYAGYVRSETMQHVTTVSWAVDRTMRGNGYAKQMVAEFCRCNDKPLLCAIRTDNVASIKVAEWAGFRRMLDGGEWFVYNKGVRR